MKYVNGYSKRFKVSKGFHIVNHDAEEQFCGEDGGYIEAVGSANDILKVIKDIEAVGYVPMFLNTQTLRAKRKYSVCFPPYENGFSGYYEVFRMTI